MGARLGGRECLPPAPALLLLILICLQSIPPACMGFSSCSWLTLPGVSPLIHFFEKKTLIGLASMLWGIERTGYVSPREAGSHLNP